MLKIINKPSDDMIFALKSLVNNTCPYPNCNKEAHVMVSSISGKKDTVKFENSIVFCNDHALLCQQRMVSESLFWDIRQFLKPNRLRENCNKSQVISSRKDYLNKVVDELKDSSTLRCIYVGPLPFHPEWYFTMHEGKFNMISMDRAINRALENPNISVSMILRNTDRYLEKVKDLIPQNLYEILIDEIYNNFNRLIDKKYNNNCILLDTGPFHIPIIYDNACIFAARDQSSSPINGGLLTYDEEQIKWEKIAFDRLFEHNEKDSIKLMELKNFLLQGLK